MKGTNRAGKQTKRRQRLEGSRRSMLWDSGPKAAEGSFRIRLCQSDDDSEEECLGTRAISQRQGPAGESGSFQGLVWKRNLFS